MARRRQTRGLEAFDRLPQPLRRWLAGAILPWSVRSAERIWTRALSEARGDEARALAHLADIERKQLARERGLQ